MPSLPSILKVRQSEVSVGDGAGNIFRIKLERVDGITQYLALRSGQSALLGRHLVCDVRLEGRKVSRRHVRLHYRTDGRVHLNDMGSHNGTYVNGVRVSETLLHGGEIIQIGEWRGLAEIVAGEFSLPSSDNLSSEDDDSGWEEFTGTQPVPDFSGGNITSPPNSSSEDVPADPEPGKDNNSGWAWKEVVGDDVEDEFVREARLVDNPLVRRFQQGRHQTDISGLVSSAAPSGALVEEDDSGQVDAVALQLMFRLMETLQASPSLDAFLAELSDALAMALRANAVVVLLKDEETDEFLPRAVKNRRAEEKIQISKTVLHRAIESRAAVTAEDAGRDARFSEALSVMNFDLKAVLVVPLVKDQECVGALYISRELPFTNTERDAVAALAHLIAVGLERARLHEKVANEEKQRRALERFHAPNVVRRLMQEANTEVTGGLFLETLPATVMFCDLSGFTSYCETHTPEMIGKLLNAYLSRMTEIIFAHGGTVDKYIGDAVMAIFGAPFPTEEDAMNAVQCALKMRQAFNQMVLEPDGIEDMDDMQVHIGINTGKVVVGTVGSTLRMEYTALGDTVNIASRLESLSRPGQIVLGESTALEVKAKVPVVPLGNVRLKGKKEPINVFEVVTTGQMDQLVSSTLNSLGSDS
ncbi:MAG: hypothetical protein CMH56_16105 [Myxococcales bacterium]|nr:hypothetical protein [Myxococcales bacterium]